MKWPIVGLVVLGLIAALSAAVLMMLLAGPHVSTGGISPDQEVAVLTATRDLPQMTLVDASAVEVQKVARSKAPEQFLSSSVQAVGKVLAVPIIKGQVYRKEMFVTEGSAAQLAAVLAPGERAVAVSLSDFASLEGVLYPGCLVDVILTINANTSEPKGISRIIFESVQVLAIERQTVINKDTDKPDDASRRASNSIHRVTLRMDSHQAAELELAASSGSLALQLRNPLDTKPANKEPVTLANLMPELNPTATPTTTPTPPVAANPPTSPLFVDDTTPAAKPGWEITIIRGTTIDKVQFPLDAATQKAPHP